MGEEGRQRQDTGKAQFMFNSDGFIAKNCRNICGLQRYKRLGQKLILKSMDSFKKGCILYRFLLRHFYTLDTPSLREFYSKAGFLCQILGRFRYWVLSKIKRYSLESSYKHFSDKEASVPLNFSEPWAPECLHFPFLSIPPPFFLFLPQFGCSSPAVCGCVKQQSWEEDQNKDESQGLFSTPSLIQHPTHW